MEKKAQTRFAGWILGAWKEFLADWRTLLPFGLFAAGLAAAFWFLRMTIGALIPPSFAGSDFVLSALFMILYWGIAGCAMCSVALAVRHGRDPTWEDVRQTTRTYRKAFVTYVISTAAALTVILIPAALVLLGLNAVAVGTGWAQIAYPLMFFCVTMLAVFIWPLKMFAVPLVIDRGADYRTAITMSVRRVRADWLGLICFHLLLAIALIPTCCFLLHAVLTPLYYLALMRAYADYFGLRPDRYAPEITDPGHLSAFEYFDAPEAPGGLTRPPRAWRNPAGTDPEKSVEHSDGLAAREEEPRPGESSPGANDPPESKPS